MENAGKILVDEKIRLENIKEYHEKKLEEIYSPALIDKTVKDQFGEDRVVKYVDTSLLSPDQEELLRIGNKKYTESRAQLCVLDNYIKSMVPQSTLQSYNQYVTPLDEFKNETISCNEIELDEEGNFAKFYIRVGTELVESSREMSFEEYTKLYSTALSKILINALGNGLNQEQTMQELAKICSEIYLNPPKMENEVVTKLS